MNQCDGCLAGFPLEGNIHVKKIKDSEDSLFSGFYHMVCTKDRCEEKSDRQKKITEGSF